MNCKTIFTTALAAIMLPIAATASVTPCDLPTGVVSVDPPQGYVDLSNNVNPLGVTQISVVFESSELEANLDAVGTVKLFMNDSDVAIDELAASSATVDQYTHQYGSIVFTKKHVAEGTYHVSIPKGTWIVDGQLSPAIELNYEIRNETTITPAAGIVDDLNNMSVTFNLADEVELENKNSLVAYALGSVDDCAVDINIEENVVNLAITLANGGQLTPATYVVFIPAGAFKLITYGENYATDETDVTIDYNKDITLKYVIPSFPKQPISPEEGKVTGFLSFTITPNEDFQLVMVDDKTRSYIYKVNDDGTLATDATYKVTAKSSSGKVLLSVLDSKWQAYTEETVPEPGNYALVLADGLFSGMYGGQFVSSAAFVYNFEVVSATDGVKIVNVTPMATEGIYNLSGVKVSGDSLSTGIYIINGKKVLVK